MKSLNIALSLCVIVPIALVPTIRSRSMATHPAAKPHAVPGRGKSGRCSTRNKPSGTITFSDWQFPDTLNPYQTSRLVTGEIDNALFDDLFRYDASATLIPQMASSIPTIQNGGIRDGGKTVVIRLKYGLRWSNGTEITSRDIQFGWKVGMDKATGPSCLGSCDDIRRIDTPDRYTAILHLKQVNASAIPAVVPDVWPHIWPNAWTDSSHAAALTLGQDKSFNFESSRYPTSGAYQVTKFVPNSHIVLRPMKYYTDMTCGGFVQNLIFAYYKSKADLVGAATARKTDVTTDYNRADVPELNKHRHAYRVHLRTSFAFEHLEFNLDPTYRHKPNPLVTPQVRLALALALDKNALIRSALVADGRTASGLAAWTPFVNTPDLKQPLVSSSPTGQWDPIVGRYVLPGIRTALSDAHQLLNRTRFKRGFTLDLYTTSGNVARQVQESAIATSWSKLGVKVHPNYVSESKLLAPRSQGGIAVHGSFQVAMFAYLGSPDPDQYRYNLMSGYCDRRARRHSTINGNNSCIRDPLIDRSFIGAARSFNPAVRSRRYAAVGAEINRQAFWVPLYFRPTISTEDGHVIGFSDNPTSLGPTWNIYAWKANRS